MLDMGSAAFFPSITPPKRVNLDIDLIGPIAVNARYSCEPNRCNKNLILRRGAACLSILPQPSPGPDLDPSSPHLWLLRRGDAMADRQYNQPLDDAALVACLHCDLLQRLPQLAPGSSVRCPRCDTRILRRREDSLDKTLPLALAAAMLYLVANLVPMLSLTILGQEAASTVVGGAVHLWNQNQKLVALLVLFTAVVAPALQIGFMLAILLGTPRRSLSIWVSKLMRHYPTARKWSMVEVMLLGVLVALIKIQGYATVIPGLALFMLGGLVFVLAAMEANFDPQEIWNRVEWTAGGRRRGPTERMQ